ncbi:hypothetical protein E3Q22_02758 [Wallemia mellicola]|nr:hypothetical protein E3Q24_02422 [Wallemia mellicola]TIB73853.1 hypothetical protein E3Q23_02861 [Wallemia mellicola]TIB78115.1 hypothetical protein E3Q22_02758 [Wallemia mellicola]TIB83612.1 hypothetical protein E3Q21_02806 [Wallemia mellicola]TIB86560.1 hypothetical protein E3Q20_02798 [Wallemia mellicola]
MSDASDESNIIHTTKTEKLSKINKNWKSLQLPNKIAIKKMLVEAQLSTDPSKKQTKYVAQLNKTHAKITKRIEQRLDHCKVPPPPANLKNKDGKRVNPGFCFDNEYRTITERLAQNLESIVLPQERIVQNLRDQLSQQRDELEFDEARFIEYTRNANKLNKHLDELEQEKLHPRLKNSFLKSHERTAQDMYIHQCAQNWNIPPVIYDSEHQKLAYNPYVDKNVRKLTQKLQPVMDKLEADAREMNPTRRAATELRDVLANAYFKHYSQRRERERKLSEGNWEDMDVDDFSSTSKEK